MRVFYHIAWLIKGVKVLALVGKSGTGKSFRAQLLALTQGIELIVDDGLLINDQKILGGRSAKRDAGGLEAIKTAMFHEKDHRDQALKIIGAHAFKRILVLGTSDRMVRRIADRLHLPSPSRIIRIEEIATQDEIEAALHSRNDEGKHIIPVPLIEVKREHATLVADAIKFFLNNSLWKRRGVVFEKTVVRPEDQERGLVSISEAALGQMVLHCVHEFERTYQVSKIVVTKEARQYGLEVILNVPFGTPVGGRLHGLRDYIIESVQRFGGVMLKEVHITVGRLGPPAAV